jgi:hypothetical protein
MAITVPFDSFLAKTRIWTEYLAHRHHIFESDSDDVFGWT